MKTYTVIKFINIELQNDINTPKKTMRLYLDETEYSFIDNDDAIAYKSYLESVKALNEEVDIYEKNINAKEELDLEGFILEEVKKKLTAQEFLILTK